MQKLPDFIILSQFHRIKKGKRRISGEILRLKQFS